MARPTHQATEVAPPQTHPSTPPASEATRARSTHPATEVAPQSTHPATEVAPPRTTDEVSWDRTYTVPGRGQPGDPGPAPGRKGTWDQRTSDQESPVGSGSEAGPGGLYRHGPGVPSAGPGAQPVPTAEEVWRTGVPPGQSPGRGRWRRRAGSALTVALLVAAGLVLFLRLHHAALGVTGVAITSQVKDGCSVDVTGRISTSGGAGTVSYQWVTTPQAGAPHPLSQSVTAGQTAIYVTVAIQGTGHLPRQVTLQILAPGQGRTTAHVNANC